MVAELLNVLASLLLALTAVYAIGAWRREYVGKRRIDLAEDVLSKFYEARDVIAAIRSPMAMSGEGSKIFEESEGRLDPQAAVVFERYNKRADLFGEILSLRYRFMAQFGRDKEKPFVDLRNVVIKIQVAARHFSALRLRDPRRESRNEERFHKYQEDLAAQEAIIYAGFDPDPISPKVDRIIEDVEMTCSVIIQRSQKRWFDR